VHPTRAASLRRAGGEHPALRSAASEHWLESARNSYQAKNFGELADIAEWRDLIPSIERLGRDPAADLPRLAAYARLVIEWNKSVSNLISRTDEARMVSRHLRESIEPAAFLWDSGATDWIDFGSGAGLPAIPLAIVGVGPKWTLVESRRPKALFLRKATAELGLGDVSVEHARLEDVVARERAAAHEGIAPRLWSGFTSRATLRLAPTLELASTIVSKSGSAFLWKGSRRSDEMWESSAWNESWEISEELEMAEGEIVVCKFLRK
jgi:16S rRNA (guanine527-N7)-methyltransferase